MPRLLLTRPEDGAADLREALADIGIDTVVAPLMTVELLPGPDLELETVQALLVTSANGVKALATRTAQRDIPVLAVGDTTAQAARNAGFEDVESAGGDVDDLAQLVRARAKPNAGVLLHAAGSVTAGNLAEMLEPAGYEVWREMIYEARPVERLPKAAETALRRADLDGVVLYSPRSARIFDRLVEKAGLTARLRELRLFALSDNVNNATLGPWKERIVAAHPDRRSLLEAVRACY